MKKSIRSKLVLAAIISLACASAFADGGDATYKSKCAMCHGATGTPSAGMAKAMGIKPASDPDMQKLTVAQISETVKTGKGKMKPIAGLTDDQIKGVSAFFKTLK
jgi:cytochrome c6